MGNLSFQLLFTILLSQTIKLCFCHDGLNATSNEIERKALLEFKSNLSDPSGRLSSWVGEDFCRWRGVSCGIRTNHVIRLDLRRSFLESYSSAIGGNISSSLLDLKYLRYIDLSRNNFEGNQIPHFFGSLKNLKYLNLSYASFSGSIPKNLGNLSKLQYLDLSYNTGDIAENDLGWVSGLSSLKHLNLGYMDLSKATSWFQAINTLPSLVELHLPLCMLHNLPLSLHSISFPSLSVLDLSANNFNSTIPQWLFNLSSLTQLDLSYNYFQGVIPDSFSKLSLLEKLDLSNNNAFEGKLPGSLGKLCNLKVLALSYNKFTGDVTDFLDSLLECPKKNLEVLDLKHNKFSGNFSKNLGQLLSLVSLNLAENPWEGTITEAHLANLSSLEEFSISTLVFPNTSLEFVISSGWIPPFRLRSIDIQSCRLGPMFPEWLKNQTELTSVVLNDAMISDTVPDWFMELNLQLQKLDIASNQLRGKAPNTLRFTELSYVDLSENLFEGSLEVWSSNVSYLYLRHNLFSGPIPQDIGIEMPHLYGLDITENFITGSIPISFANLTGLSTLSLKSNLLSGKVPEIWEGKPSLYIVDMSENSLSGSIPSSLGSVTSLLVLVLSGNNLEGELSSNFRNCTYLKIIDLGDNRLSGNLQAWIQEGLPPLRVLRLRNNSFTGAIPSQICSLFYLHVLDLSHNNLSGSIPSCVGNLSGFKTESYSFGMSTYPTGLLVVAKGNTLPYGSTLNLFYSLDLSGNNLIGEIPESITSLLKLNVLNLSRNLLTGKIPSEIGSLKSLETLDLSVNYLTGPIPTSMVSLNFLSHLNLSYNNLSGSIPSSNQLQSLNDPSIYMGNVALCGSPLPTKCANETSVLGGSEGMEDVGDDDDGLQTLIFFVVAGGGFFLGFWGVCGTLVIKKRFRDAYFDFLQRLKDKIC